LSKYKDFIVNYIKENPEWIQPEQFRKETLAKIEGYGELKDLSISRSTFSWGVPVPEDGSDDESHVMYVWFDALTNYVTG
jgi:methionyl-tRNA synthetase